MTRVVRRLLGAMVTIGSAAACAATVHAVWNTRSLRRPSHQPQPVDEPVAVLVPARDEARNIGACLDSLRAQAGVPELQIVVLDDQSTDATPDIVARHVAQDSRVRLVRGNGDPPAGWVGKTWACQRLADAVTSPDPASTPGVLVFVDADVRLEPPAVAAAVQLLRTSQLDLVSPYPRQVAVTAAERLVQPLLQWSWLTFLPLAAAERSPRPSLAAANGQFLVVDAAAYAAVDGHAAVASEVVEDVALVRALKRAGRSGVVVDGTWLASCRMYDDWPSLRDGYTKSLWAAFGSSAGALAVAGGLAVMYVLPPVAAVAGSRTGLVGYAAAVAGRAWVAHRVGGRVWPDALAHPMSVTVFGYLVTRSLQQRRTGALRWKGRPLPLG